MRRPSNVSLLSCPCGPRERIICDDLKAQLGIDSDANLVRTALYSYAVYVLGSSAVDTDTFRLQRHKGLRKRVERPHRRIA